MKQTALLLTAGLLNHPDAKTAHGLIRSSSRYTVVGVIDKKQAGRDAGSIVNHKANGIPVYAFVQEYLSSTRKKADCVIVSIAVPGGRLPENLLSDIRDVIRSGMNVVSGLHDHLNDMPELVELAEHHRVTLTDIRKQRPKEQLRFWSGEVFEINCPVIAVLGTDCAIGKRTTANLLTESLRQNGCKAEMVYTGQTGWLQGHGFGFIFDATCNDFISGELEHALVACSRNLSPEVIVIEGQSALCNPSGPCGSELLLSGNAKGVILQHAPARIYYKGQEKNQIPISLPRELDLIKLYGSSVIAITLNTSGLSLQEARSFKSIYETQFNIPVILPIEEGCEELASVVREYKESYENKASQGQPT